MIMLLSLGMLYQLLALAMILISCHREIGLVTLKMANGMLRYRLLIQGITMFMCSVMETYCLLILSLFL